MGRQAYQCKYDTIGDKELFNTTLRPGNEVAAMAKTSSSAMSRMSSAKKFAGSLVTNNDAILDKYNGEIFFTKTGQKCKDDTSKHVYIANNTLCNIDQGSSGLLSCQVGDIATTVKTLSAVLNPVIECKSHTVNTCYEQGLRIAPLGGPFSINIGADDNASMDIFNYLKNNPHNHINDRIPDEYNRATIQCDSFENINEYSNYINSIKEFNGPNYIRNIYYSALFIFLFYIFIKLYIKK
tara:strand:- start:359 stop:1075 length:717 start_codon:yes stop_codon:yes gene_type:complete